MSDLLLGILIVVGGLVLVSPFLLAAYVSDEINKNYPLW